jgi:hypothetical protein
MGSAESSVLNASAISNAAKPYRYPGGVYRIAAVVISLLAWWLIVEAFLYVFALL